jgi:hypothetical protein
MLHGLYLAIHRAWRGSLRADSSHRKPGWWSRPLTFLAVIAAWVFFRAADLNTAVAMLKSMAGINGLSLPKRFAAFDNPVGLLRFDGFLPNDLTVYTVRPFVMPSLLILLLVCWFLPNIFEIIGPYRPALMIYRGAPVVPRWHWRPLPAWALATGLIFAATILGMGGSVSEFLYFQF